MAPRTYGDEDEEPEVPYHESSDEDFNPDSAPADDAPSSSEDDGEYESEDEGRDRDRDKGRGKGKSKDKGKDKGKDATALSQRRGKRKARIDTELDSGDEVTIQAARKKAKQRKQDSSGDEDLVVSDDEGGDGGLIKTRAQRAVEKKERRPLARTEGATVDVEALWAQMTAAPLQPLRRQEHPESQDAAPATAPTAETPVEEELLAVTKTYTFAGQNTTEEKQIPRSSLAKYTADGWKPTSAAKTADAAEGAAPNTPQSHILRPLRRPTRFDPNPAGFVRALAPEHQLTWPRKSTAPVAPSLDAPANGPTKPNKATKLNVVDKSRMDWTGFVDKEGIAEELHEHGKSKDNYMSRRDFLAGVEQRMDEEGRRARVSNATALT